MFSSKEKWEGFRVKSLLWKNITIRNSNSIENSSIENLLKSHKQQYRLVENPGKFPESRMAPTKWFEYPKFRTKMVNKKELNNQEIKLKV